MKSQNEETERTLISMDDIPEEHREEVLEWLKKQQVEFDALSKVTGWPIEKIYQIYNAFGVHLGMGFNEEKKES